MGYQKWTEKRKCAERFLHGLKGLLNAGRRNDKWKMWLICMFAAAWWGILYPELCFTEETFQAVIVTEEETAGEQTDVQRTEEQITYRDILNATGGEVVIRSRFLEWVEEYIENRSDMEDNICASPQFAAEQEWRLYE